MKPQEPAFFDEESKSLVGAMQLGIKTKIIRALMHPKQDSLRIDFGDVAQDDKGLNYLIRIFDDAWDPKKRQLTIRNVAAVFATPLINFLMLSRLQEQNMRALAQLDDRYHPFVEKVFGATHAEPETICLTPQAAAQLIFSHVEKRKMTLRELAEKSGLTQVALSNFKAGRDIRLSSLLKIIKVLGLKLAITATQQR